ncbi:MAG: hypothetical protein LBG67_01805 [Campylobacteraceae bacterium]|jgi:ABC-type transport system involved in multi-copper enzyme maturation permease subunit|nr:hypothetical protein [Campylobacteraceae bacterium]
MNYFKYAGLFVAILFWIFVVIVAIFSFVIFNFANEILANIAIVTLFISPIVALVITSATVSNMIIKSNGRVMTFGEEDLFKKEIIFKKHFNFSKVSFFVFLISFIFYLYVKIFNDAADGDFVMAIYAFIFYIPYVVYIILHSIFVFMVYKKPLKYNIISFIIIVITATLNYTGFSYPNLKYLSKAEQIDIGLLKYKYNFCYDNGYKNIKKECPYYNLDDLKQEYPECFTNDRPDKCRLYEYKNKNDRDILGFNRLSEIYSPILAEKYDTYGDITVYSSGVASSFVANSFF